ncbi:LGFP repeat-containing protein, partial [Blastococcus sp. SYSU D00813]
GAQLVRWGGQGWETGPLGYPTTDTVCGLRDGGCFQHFQGGSVYSSTAGGARVVAGEVLAAWRSSGWERGVLGYPTGELRCGYTDGGCFQAFEHGAVYVSASTPASVVTEPARSAWGAQQWERGLLGYPTGNTTCGLRDSGCFQHFQGGSVYSSATTGAHVVPATVRTRWQAAGWERGALGYPTADQVCGLRDGGCYQSFQGGTVYTSAATGTRVVAGGFLALWSAESREAGDLGYPVGEQTCGLREGGCFQHFQGGSIYSSTTGGTHAVVGPVRDGWKATGWERGVLGYPSADRVCGLPGGGCRQQFAGGVVSTS